MRYLPYYTSSSKALTAGIRAATMIAFGRMSKNIDMQREAMWWYTYTLRLQSIGVSQYMQPPPAKSTIPTPDDLCISMMLMYYELIYPTSPGSWVRHLYGAARLLELRGAENCQSGFPHVLFRALRLLVVRKYAIIAPQSLQLKNYFLTFFAGFLLYYNKTLLTICIYGMVHTTICSNSETSTGQVTGYCLLSRCIPPFRRCHRNRDRVQCWPAAKAAGPYT